MENISIFDFKFYDEDNAFIESRKRFFKMLLN
jgi:hypothetical protein